MIILSLSFASVYLSFLQIFGGIYILGTSSELDIIIFAQTIPQFLFILFNYSITNALISILNKKNNSKIDSIIWYLLWKYLTILIIAILSLAVLNFIFNEKLIDLFNNENNHHSLLLSLIKVNFISLPGMLFVIIFGAGLRAKGLNKEEQCSNVFAQLISVIGYIIFLYKGEILIANILLVIRYYLASLIMNRWIQFQRPKKNIYSKEINLYNKELKTLLIGTALLKTGFLFDRSIALYIGSGSLAALTFVQQIYSSVEYIITRVMITPYNNRLSVIIKSGYYKKIEAINKKRAIKIFCYSSASYLLIIAIFLLIMNLPYLKIGSEINFETIKFSLIFLVGQIIFSPLASFFNANFYSAGISKIPVIIGVVSTVIGILFKYFLAKNFGLNGLSIAISLQFLLAIILLYRSNQRIICGKN